MKSSLQAHLLVASPRLPDTNFYRSVVLMIQHDEDGAFGLILNRPTELTVAEVWEQIGETTSESPRPIKLGGPVAGPLMAVHSNEEYSQVEILPGVYYSTQKEFLDEIVNRDDLQNPFHIFSGYAGWGAGQLEGELEAGGWLTTPAKYDHIFNASDDLWKDITGEIGAEILFSAGKTKHLPIDPSLN